MPVFTDSSAVWRAEYDDNTATLCIWFARRGRRYDYYNVPRPIFDGLCAAASKGEYFNEHIRHVYGR
jgi:hypothetical protein